MTDDHAEQLDKIRQAIAALEVQQRELSLDHTAHIAELRQREKAISISQSGAGTVAWGGVAAGERGIAVGGAVFGDIYHVYQSPPGRQELSQKDFERILNDYLAWVQNAYSKARLYGLESLPQRKVAPCVTLRMCLYRSRYASFNHSDALRWKNWLSRWVIQPGPIYV